MSRVSDGNETNDPTPVSDDIETSDAAQPPEPHIQVLKGNPSDEEVAGSIVYLASSLSSAMTGQAIDTNGGEIFT